MSVPMITICQVDVPQYLRVSAHFHNLFQDSSDEESADRSVPIPVNCFKREPRVANGSELYELLRTLRFWLLPKFIEGNENVLSFILDNKSTLKNLVAEFRNEFPYLEKLAEALQETVEYTVMGNAVRLGMCDLVEVLFQRGHSWDVGPKKSFTKVAAKNGHFDCLSFAVGNGCTINSCDMCSAAINGHVECMKYFQRKGCFCGLTSFSHGPLHGADLSECVQILMSISRQSQQGQGQGQGQGLYAEKNTASARAAEQGHAEVVSCLHKPDLPWGATNDREATEILASISNMQYLCIRPEKRRNIWLTHSDAHFERDLAMRVQLFTSIKHGDIVVLQRLRNRSCPWGVNAMATAVEMGQLECVRFLHENGCAWNAFAMSFAAMEGHLEILTYMHQHGCPWDSSVTAAALFIPEARKAGGISEGKLACLKYALQNGCSGTAVLHKRAASFGSIDLLKYMLQQKVPWDATATAAAAHLPCEAGLPCLAYLLDRGCPVNASSYRAAVAGGNLSVLQWLHYRGAAWNSSVTAAAVESGHEACLQFLLEGGCPVSTAACHLAAETGNLDLLVRLREHNAPWNSSIVAVSMKNKHWACLLYALEHGCPGDAEAYVQAAKNNQLRILQLLHQQQQIPIWSTAVVTEAIKSEALPCLRYALEQGCPVDRAACSELAWNCSLECMGILHKHGCLQWREDACKEAVARDRPQCLKYSLLGGCAYTVPGEVLAKAPRCQTYMDVQGFKIVQKREALDGAQEQVV